VTCAVAVRVRGDVWIVCHYGVTSLARKDYLAATLGFSQRSWSSERLHCPRMESTRTMPQCRPRFRLGVSSAAQPRIGRFSFLFLCNQVHDLLGACPSNPTHTFPNCR